MTATYNCDTSSLTITNTAFTISPSPIVVTIAVKATDCTNTAVSANTYTSGSNLTFTTGQIVLTDTDISGDGVYTLSYTYDEVDYTGCVFVLCADKCTVYNAIADNLGSCNCSDSDIDTAYNIFMHTQVIQQLSNCNECCKAEEVYSNLLSLINDCESC